MADIADHDDWTPDDDALLRGALATLREDIDAEPLPEVRFVRARGVRRSRQRALALTSAAAAAAVVVGSVGYGQLGQDSTLPLPPATRATAGPAPTAPTTTSTTVDPLAEPGALPIVTDWTSALGLTGTVRLTPVKPFHAVECLDVEPGTKVQQDGLTRDAGGPSGGQVRFALGAGTDPETAASGVASDIADCVQGTNFRVSGLVESDAGALLPYTAGDAGSGWFAVVRGARDVAVLQVVDPDHAKSVFTQEQVQTLAARTKERLTRYGTGTSGAAATSTSPAGAGSNAPTGIGPTGGTKALSEDMPVSGPDPVPSSALFVAASQWQARGFRSDATTRAASLDSAPSIGGIGVFCETEEYLNGVGGTFGVVTVEAGTGDANVIGRQRVRVDTSSDDTQKRSSAASQVATLSALLGNGCTETDGKVIATPGPSKGTYLLTKSVTGEATGKDHRWVGITTQQTPGVVTTIVFHGTSDGQGFTGRADQGFAELDRLLMLARQK